MTIIFVEEKKKKESTENSFAWDAVMTEVLRSAPGNEMGKKSLGKAVLAEWTLFRFNKRLKNANVFEVHDKRVKLVAAENLSSGPQAAENIAGKGKKRNLKCWKKKIKCQLYEYLDPQSFSVVNPLLYVSVRDQIFVSFFVEEPGPENNSIEESAGTPRKPKMFAWEAAMSEALRSAPDNEMDVKTLCTAVQAEYESWLPEDVRKKRFKIEWYKFEEKLKRRDLFEVKNNAVKLVAAESDADDD